MLKKTLLRAIVLMLFFFSFAGMSSLFPALSITVDVRAVPESGGTVSGGGNFAAGSIVTVTAKPNSGFKFANWMMGGVIVSTSPTHSYYANGNHSIIANFTQGTADYSISVSAGTGGRATGGGTFAAGTTRTISAISDQGYTFLNWTENGRVVSTSASYTFVLAGNRSLVANFMPINFTVSLSSNPGEGGKVSGEGSFPNGSARFVSATANSGYVFASWTENGQIVSTSANYTFTLNRNRTLEANFNVVNHTISVSAVPSEGGQVTGGGSYMKGASRTISATPRKGFTFANWMENGKAVSTEANYTFILNGNRTLIANFNISNHTVALSAVPSEGGQVSGSGSFTNGSHRTVSAKANNGYAFTNWTEGGQVISQTADYAFTLNENRTLVANFTQKSEEKIKLNLQTTPSRDLEIQWGNGGILQASSSINGPWTNIAEARSPWLVVQPRNSTFFRVWAQRTTPEPGNNSFSLNVSSPSVSLSPGSSTNLVVLVQRHGGFNKTVTVSLENLPPGIRATSSIISADGNGTSITLSVDPAITATNFVANVRGRSSDGLTQTVQVAVSVLSTPSGQLSITLSESSLSLFQSIRHHTKITVKREGGLTGPVHLSIEGLPISIRGVLESVYLAPTDSNTELLIIVERNQNPGTWPVRIKARIGEVVSTATLMLTIKAPVYRGNYITSYDTYYVAPDGGRCDWEDVVNCVVEIDFSKTPAQISMRGKKTTKRMNSNTRCLGSEGEISVSGSLNSTFPDVDATLTVPTSAGKEIFKFTGGASGAELRGHVHVIYVRDGGGGGTLGPEPALALSRVE